MRTRVLREGARVRALIGEGDGKVGRKEREIGGGSEEGGVNEGGKEINGNRKVEQRMKKGKTRIGKAFTLCEKRSAEKIKGEISRRSARSRTQNGERREKSGLHRAKKRERALEKVPEIESKTGKSGKNGDFGVKKEGWGSGEKMGFTADFAML